MFGRKKKELLEQEEAERQRREAAARLKANLEHKLANDPVFQITTVDKMYWIDPFTARAFSTPFGYRETALAYLLKEQPWRKTKTRSLGELQILRWVHYLKAQISSDQRFAMFTRKGWINPFTGAPVEGIAQAKGKITPQSLFDMAKVLCQTPQAQRGEPLPMEKLEQKAIDAEQGSRQELGELHAGMMTIEESTPINIQALDEAALEMVERRQEHPSTIIEPTDEPDDDERLVAEEWAKAKNVQQKLLTPIPDLEGLQIGLHFTPQDQIGGDFYFFHMLDSHRLFFALADVSGHGVQGALVVATAIKALRFTISRHHDLADILCELNDNIKDDLLQEQFITMYAAVLDIESGELTGVSAGHHPAALGDPTGRHLLQRLGGKGMALGVVKGDMFRRALRPETVEMQPGQILLQYTDGLVEAMDDEATEFGHFRAYGCFLVHAECGVIQEIVDRMAVDVRGFCNDDVGDDLSILAIGYRLPEPEYENDEAPG